MELFREVMLVIHLTFGVAALGLFWVPALTRKGGPAHRRAGRWYAVSMATVLVTGVFLAGLFLAQGRWVFGVFLLFLGVITGTSLWNGWRSLRAKQGPARYLTAAHVIVAGLNVATGAAMIALGAAFGQPLLLYFGPVGFLIGGLMLALAWRPPEDRMYWLYEHFGGMIGSGIASHVAFLAFGGRQLFGYGTTGAGVWLWVAPVVVGTLAITAANFYYRAKYAPRPAPA